MHGDLIIAEDIGSVKFLDSVNGRLVILVVNKGIEVFHSDILNLSEFSEILLDILLTLISVDSRNVDLCESFRISISSIFTWRLSSTVIVKTSWSSVIPRARSRSISSRVSSTHTGSSRTSGTTLRSSVATSATRRLTSLLISVFWVRMV